MFMVVLIRISHVLYESGISTPPVLRGISLATLNDVVCKNVFEIRNNKRNLSIFWLYNHHCAPIHLGPSTTCWLIQVPCMYKNSIWWVKILEEPSKMLTSRKGLRWDAKHQYPKCQYLPFFSPSSCYSLIGENMLMILHWYEETIDIDKGWNETWGQLHLCFLLTIQNGMEVENSLVLLSYDHSRYRMITVTMQNISLSLVKVVKIWSSDMWSALVWSQW